MAPTASSFLRPPPLPHHPHPRIRLPLPPPPSASPTSSAAAVSATARSASSKNSPPPPPTPTPSPTASSTAPPSTPTAPTEAPPVDPDAFEKEMMGLTGGFPGGEVGLNDFVAKNPPPLRAQRKPGAAGLAAFVPAERPRPPELPLFLPGMVVLVKNPNNAYHMYCGIVQRVTDGKVGVLFEGGNWDRLITFDLDELEGREKGPPMVNPKSVVLEALAAELDDEGEKETEKEEEEVKKKKEKEGTAATA